MMSRRAVVGDIFAIELQPIQAARDPRMLFDRPDDDKPVNAYEARTIEKQGRPIACFGITQTLPNCGEAWAFLSKEALDLGKKLTEEVYFWLDKTQREYELRRVTAVTSEDHPAGHRWLLRLGFEPEGRMRRYGIRGETCWLYARVR